MPLRTIICNGMNTKAINEPSPRAREPARGRPLMRERARPFSTRRPVDGWHRVHAS
jgi:hypothetical protein